jgi:hypothetical protein
MQEGRQARTLFGLGFPHMWTDGSTGRQMDRQTKTDRAGKWDKQKDM